MEGTEREPQPVEPEASKPNAWRIYDAYGEHCATVYEQDMLEAWLTNDGYTAKPVTIRDPRW